jgi:hypothetical protein
MAGAGYALSFAHRAASPQPTLEATYGMTGCESLSGTGS